MVRTKKAAKAGIYARKQGHTPGKHAMPDLSRAAGVLLAARQGLVFDLKTALLSMSRDELILLRDLSDADKAVISGQYRAGGCYYNADSLTHELIDCLPEFMARGDHLVWKELYEANAEGVLLKLSDVETAKITLFDHNVMVRL